jgi:hypothetical protein
LSRVASRTLHAYVSATLGEANAAPRVLSPTQSFESLAHWHPHLHLVGTDGAFRRDGNFVAMTMHDAVVLTEVSRRGPRAIRAPGLARSGRADPRHRVGRTRT